MSPLTFKLIIILSCVTTFIPSTICGSFLRLTLFKKCVTISGLPSNAIIDRKTGGSNYDFLNHQWNTRVRYVYPMAYVLPTSTKHVQAVVYCARKINIPVIPKSGGHSYESYSFGNSSTLIIDFRNMSSIKINAKDQVVKIGSGALFGQIYNHLWKSGKFSVAMGDCLSVGIGGYTLGGGTGHFSYLYGLAIDNLIEMTMVDANGGAHTVNAQRNSDLFWGLRGVGSGLIGIVTNFKFKMFDASKLKFTFAKIHFEKKHSFEFLIAWQKWFAWAEKNEPLVYPTGFVKGPVSLTSVENGYDIRLLHIQDPIRQRSGNKAFLKALNEVFPADIVKITTKYYTSFIDFLQSISYAQFAGVKNLSSIDWEHPRKYLTQRRYHKRMSFFVNQYFNESAWEKAAELLRTIPKRNVWLGITGERGLVNDVQPGAMAYVHRKSLYNLIFTYEGSSDPKAVAEGMAWLENFMSALKEMDSGEIYQNYPDRNLKNYLERYYGDNLPRIINVKQRWDPENYLQDPQSIPVHEV